jgi:hypothetical protein
MLDLRKPPAFLAGQTHFGDEVIVGFRALTDGATAPFCEQSCLAPGSSPHAHTTVIGYQVVTLTGIFELDLNGVCYRSSSLHSTLTYPKPGVKA